jgi:hypothetical protein
MYRKLQSENCLEDLGIGQWAILKFILEKCWECVDWIHQGQNRNQWWAVCECINKPLGSVIGGNFLTS